MAENQQDPKASGALAATPAKTWRTIVLPDAQAAASYLNVSPAQGAGEAFASNRPDGSVDLYFYL